MLFLFFNCEFPFFNVPLPHFNEMGNFYFKDRFCISSENIPPKCIRLIIFAFLLNSGISKTGDKDC